MERIDILKKQAKKYIDAADDKVVKVVHAILEKNAEDDWWSSLPDDVRDEINGALIDLDEGKGISHEEVKKMHPQWFSK